MFLSTGSRPLRLSVSPTLQSEFLTTGPQGKPWVSSLTRNPLLCSSCFSSTGSLGVPLEVLPQSLCRCCFLLLERVAPRYLPTWLLPSLPTCHLVMEEASQHRGLFSPSLLPVSCSSLSLTGLTVFHLSLSLGWKSVRSEVFFCT